MITNIPHEVINRLRRQLLIERNHELRKNQAETEADVAATERALRAQQLIMERIKGELRERHMTEEKIVELLAQENSRHTSELEWLTAER